MIAAATRTDGVTQARGAHTQVVACRPPPERWVTMTRLPSSSLHPTGIQAIEPHPHPPSADLPQACLVDSSGLRSEE